MLADLAERLFALAETRNARNHEIAFSGRSFHLIQDTGDAERILRSNAGNYEKALGWFSQVIGPSRLTENGEAWQARQQLSQRHLSKCSPSRVFQLSRAHGERGVELLLERAGRGDERLDDGLFRVITSGILMEALFDRSWESLGFPDFGPVTTLLRYAEEYCGLSADQGFGHGGRLGMSRESTRAMLQSRHETLGRLSALRESVTADDPMLWDFLRHEEVDGTFTLEHEVLMFLAAGSETSAAAIGWGVYLLAREPALQESLRRELQDFWRSDDPSFAGLQRIDRFARFVAEVMRIFPPTPVLTLRALGPDRLSDREILAGDPIMISIVGLNHSRLGRSDPWAIQLQPASETDRLPNLTFSAGPRVCGGRHFAVAEVMTVLAVMLNAIRLELTSQEAPSFRWCFSLNPRNGHPVRATPLSPRS
jgi:cytochrome P450